MKIALLIVLILVAAFIYSDDSDIYLFDQSVNTWILSPGYYSTLGYGFGSVSNDGRKENLTVLHTGLAPIFLGAGIYFQKRYFKDHTRTGLFYTFDLGADLIFGGVGDPGGGSADFHTLPVPIIAGGIGYSKKIGKSSFFRISIDLGIKAVISNLNLSVTF